LLAFLNVLSGKIDIIMLSLLTTSEQVGIYAFAYMLIRKGLFVRKAVAQSLFPEYSISYVNGTIKSSRLFKHTLIIALPALMMVCVIPFISKPLITYIAGVNFQDSAYIVNVLAFYLVFNYMLLPFGVALQVSHNEKTLLVIGIIRACSNVVLNLVFFHLFGIIGIAYSTLLTYAISVFIIFITGWKKFSSKSSFR